MSADRAGLWLSLARKRLHAVASGVYTAGMKRLPRGFFPGAPDLAVEVLSPSDMPGHTHEKLTQYFSHGTRLAWVINPAERNALVYRTPEADRLLRVTDALDGEDVLPGFRLPLAELFAELSFE